MYKTFNNVPISLARAKSYVHNPNAHTDDVALILGFKKNRLIAYRSFFAGRVKNSEQNIHFGWCSGNWVHPDFRRKGYSKRLLEEAFQDWNGKLMFTNYAPASEQLYLKTDWFQVVHQFNGIRAYLYPKTQKLLSFAQKKQKLKPLFWLTDAFISFLAGIRAGFYKQKRHPKIHFEILPEPDEKCFNHLENRNINFIFGRKTKELKWIFQYPWISDENKEVSLKYSFSSYSGSFYYQVVRIFKEEEFAGFFIFSVKDGHLKTLYFSVPNDLNEEIADYLKKFCVEKRIEVATVYNSGVANRLFKRKFPFLHIKRYGQKIYSSFQLKEIDGFQFQDGDGDVIFT